MGRVRKSKRAGRSRYANLADLTEEAEEESDLPKDEAGRRKIKRQYVELLGIRLEKLRGRILNRERINKTIEGIYFICAACLRVCHSLDDGLLEDPDNQHNLCGDCDRKQRSEAAGTRRKRSADSTHGGRSRRSRARAS